MSLIIFDCDGVLVDSELLHAQAETDWIKEKLGVEFSAVELNRRFSGTSQKHMQSFFEKEFGCHFPPHFDTEVNQLKQKLFAEKLKPMPYMRETLEQIKNKLRCVASNTHLPTLEVSLKITGLFEFFSPHVFSGDMVKNVKPAPDLFLYAARQMNTKPEECLVIEDGVRGVQAALAAGMKVLGFIGGTHCYPGYADTLEGCKTVFSDMRELPSLISQFMDVTA